MVKPVVATPPKPKLYSISDIRVVLGGIGTVTVYKLFKDNILTRRKIGRRTFGLVEEVDRLAAGKFA